LCNFDGNKGGTTPVGNYSPQGDSPYGCVDMSGNVWEWTSSLYQEGKDWRVVRGGSWGSLAVSARAAFRSYSAPFYRSYNMGIFAYPPKKVYSR
jgi:formylglycine-generating enzyme required for sulfatase activity